LTGRRGKRFWLSTRSHPRVSSRVGRDRGRQRSPSPDSHTVENAAARKPPRRGRLLRSESSEGRTRSMGRSWGASSNAIHPGSNCAGQTVWFGAATHGLTQVGHVRSGRRRTKVGAVGSRAVHGYSITRNCRLQKLDTGIFLVTSRRAERRTETGRDSQAGRSSRVTTVEAARSRANGCRGTYART